MVSQILRGYGSGQFLVSLRLWECTLKDQWLGRTRFPEIRPINSGELQRCFIEKDQTLTLRRLMIVWQDTLLSLCHDRLPAAPIHAWNMNEELPVDNSLSYVGVMIYLSRLGLKFMNRKAGGDLALEDLIDTLTMIDKMYQHAQPYLQSKENCQNMLHHLERLAVKLHISHFISFVCRPAVKNSGLANNPSHQLLHQRARESLMEAIRTFLEFQALSIVPMRNWSMIHAVIGSTLLLSIWEETHWDQECQELQQRVIEVFSAVESKDDGSSENSQWLSQRHIWALVSLRNSVKAAMERNTDTGQPRTDNDGNSHAESDRLNSSFSPSGFPLSYDFRYVTVLVLCFYDS